MKIKMLKPAAMEGLKRDAVYDLPEEKAKMFISIGAAISLEQLKEEPVKKIIEKVAIVEEDEPELAVEEKPQRKTTRRKLNDIST